MAAITASEARRPAGRTVHREAPKLPLAASRGVIGALLFMFVALFLLAAGAVAGAPDEDGAPAEVGAFILDPSITAARG